MNFMKQFFYTKKLLLRTQIKTKSNIVVIPIVSLLFSQYNNIILTKIIKKSILYNYMCINLSIKFKINKRYDIRKVNNH